MTSGELNLLELMLNASLPVQMVMALLMAASVLWNGCRLWVLLEGHPADVSAQATGSSLTACEGPPALPTGSRRIVPPASVGSMTGDFVAEVGVGVVHHAEALPVTERRESSVTKLTRRIKAEFDPSGRLNPGVSLG